MPTTIEKVLEVREGLRALIALDSPKPLELDGKSRYDLWRSFRKAQRATKDYDEARDGLIRQLGSKGPEGQYVVTKTLQLGEGQEPVANPNYAKLTEEVKQLRLTEVEFTPVTFPASLFEKSPQVSLALVDMLCDVGVLTED